MQESLFELISSEASYLRSLNVLVSHFAWWDVEELISKWDYRVLFHDMVAVRRCSGRFLNDLKEQFDGDTFVIDGGSLLKIVAQHARDKFQAYVSYCSNQSSQGRVLKKLKCVDVLDIVSSEVPIIHSFFRAENPHFLDVLQNLESSSACQKLSLESFLNLPMQRVTRLPLLVDAINKMLQLTGGAERECETGTRALDAVKEV